MELALAGSLVLVILYNLFFYQIPTGIGIGVFILLINIFFHFSTRTRQTNKLVGISLGAIGTLFAFLLATRANLIVQLIDLVSASFFTLASLFSYRIKNPPDFKITSILFSPMNVVGSAIVDFSNNLKATEFTNFKKHFTEETVSALIRGIVIAFPVVFILYLILQAADPIFSTLSVTFFKSIGNRLLVSIGLFIALLALGVVKIYQPEAKEDEGAMPQAKAVELTIIIGAVAILFAAFIIVQFKYLFSNIDERQLQAIGVKSLTYSEYVRKGFFELLLASGISCLIVTYGIKFVHKISSVGKVIVQSLLSILTIETALILISAAQRLNLYQQGHGLTRARIFGFDFLLWLAAVLFILLMQVMAKQKREIVFALSIAATVIAISAINLTNIDRKIAIDFRPTVNKEIDYSYIAALSSDAKDSWREIITSSQQLANSLDKKEDLTTDDRRQLQLARLSLGHLTPKTNDLIDKYASDEIYQNWYTESSPGLDVSKRRRSKWHSFNFSEHAAYVEVEKNIEFYKQISKLHEQILQLETKPQNNQQPVPMDRPEKAPLTF